MRQRGEGRGRRRGSRLERGGETFSKTTPVYAVDRIDGGHVGDSAEADKDPGLHVTCVTVSGR